MQVFTLSGCLSATKGTIDCWPVPWL